MIVIPTVGAARHAEKVAELGVDAVIAQGSEGGGHTGVIPTSLLIPQVIDSIKIPVIAAGGFTDGRGLAAALAWGASGIAMGTRFLLTSESDVPENVKNVYLSTSSTQTVVTKAIDGAPQRVISNKMVERLERARLLAFPIALLNALRFRRFENEKNSEINMESGGPCSERTDVDKSDNGRWSFRSWNFAYRSRSWVNK